MRVERRNVAAVLQNDRVAVAVLDATKTDFSVTGRNDRCAGRRGIIDAAVGADCIQYRMPTIEAKRRADAREIYGRTDESLAYATSVRSEVIRVAAAVDVARCALGGALIYKFGRDNRAIPKLHTVAP